MRTDHPVGPGDDRQRVLDATDIVRLIGEHLALKPKGREFVALCPFHDDHSPSMCVVPAKQIYHCFSCQAGGNAIGFVMNYHKMTFREALEYLAQRAGIELTPRNLWRGQAGAAGARSSGGVFDDADTAHTSGGVGREEMLGANATAQTFFRAILAHAEHGRLARQILADRGVSDDMVAQFQLGAAPDKWDGLTLTISNKGLSTAPFQATGLLKSRESGNGVYDAFRNRLMFPIHDQIGRVIGFGGRRLNDQDEPKYINSSESAIFDKSTTLYGLHQAAQTIRRTRIAIVTEGYMDTIACHQAGLTNAVATLGTALTPGNGKLLKRFCDTVVLLFDGDQAGQKAAERGVEVFFAEPVDVRIAMLSTHTDAKDPDELLKRDGGRSVLDKIIADAVDPMELLFARVRASISGLGLSARGKAVDEFVTRLVDLGLTRVDKVRYQLIVRRLADIVGVDWETIVGLVDERRERVRARIAARAGTGSFAREGSGESPSASAGAASGAMDDRVYLLGCILCDPSLPLSLTEEDGELLDPASYTNPELRGVAQVIAELSVQEQTPSLQAVLATTEDAGVQRTATGLAALVDRLAEGDTLRVQRLWRERLAEWRASVRGRSLEPEGLAGDVQPSGSAGDRLESIIRLRRAQLSTGNDPRAMPKPGAGVGPGG